MTYSVRDEPDFEPTYDEDEIIQVRKGDLRAVLDVATMSMDFGSGFLDNEQVEALRKAADLLGIDLLVVTPHNFVCQYTGRHQWQFNADPSSFSTDLVSGERTPTPPHWWCFRCDTFLFDANDPSSPPGPDVYTHDR